jgi:hypothetical protein
MLDSRGTSIPARMGQGRSDGPSFVDQLFSLPSSLSEALSSDEQLRSRLLDDVLHLWNWVCVEDGDEETSRGPGGPLGDEPGVAGGEKAGDPSSLDVAVRDIQGEEHKSADLKKRESLDACTENPRRSLPKPDNDEEVGAGFRWGCFLYPKDGCRVQHSS